MGVNRNNLYLLISLIVTALCRDLSENERSTRAAFIQKLLSKEKRMEGKVKLLGGYDQFEGKCLFCNFI